jgi:hypothetical protein
MLTITTKLRAMTAKQLHNTLMAEYPDNLEMRESIKAGINKEREDKRVHRIKRQQQLKAWAPLIHQAYKAVNTPKARARKAFELYSSPTGYGSPYEAGFDESPSKQALDTYRAYTALVQKVADRLRGFRDRGTHTPKQMAKEDGIPNEGEHWSDWIPEQIKAQFEHSFARLNEEKPLALFPRTFYAPPKEAPYKPRKHKPKRERSLSRVEQLRAELLEADKLCLERPTRENLEQRDTLILMKEEAARDKRREYAKKYNAKIRAELQAWRLKQQQLGEEA